MHKHVWVIVSIAAIAAFTLIPTAADELFALFFVGLVPFTEYTIPPLTMLVAYIVLLTLGIYALTRQLVTVATPIKRDVESRERARKKILRRSAKLNNQHVSRQKKHFLPAAEPRTR